MSKLNKSIVLGTFILVVPAVLNDFIPMTQIDYCHDLWFIVTSFAFVIVQLPRIHLTHHNQSLNAILRILVVVDSFEDFQVHICVFYSIRKDNPSRIRRCRYIITALLLENLEVVFRCYIVQKAHADYNMI